MTERYGMTVLFRHAKDRKQNAIEDRRMTGLQPVEMCVL